MCGLFGWQLRDGQDAISTNQLAIVASVLCSNMDRRGGDSWGFYVPAYDKLRHGLGQMSRSISGIDLAEHDSVMAHTRKATTGRVSVRNAHPFRFDTLVGAHNGMVSNHLELNWLYSRECSVDSQHIFLHLQDRHPLHEVEAYGTIEYVHLGKPDRLNLCAFDGGELAAYRIKRAGVIWASTHNAVLQALSLAGLKGRAYRIEDGRLYQCVGGRLVATGTYLPFAPYHAFGGIDDRWRTR